MKNLLYHLRVFLSRVSAFFSRVDHLHHDRFARLYELGSLLSQNLGGTSLLLGMSQFSYVLRVRSTRQRRELGNLLVVAPTRGGKGLLAVSQLLCWPHSVVVNDIKGDLFAQTAGFRRTLGKVYVIDPTGIGHQYDPLKGRETEGELYSSAKHLLYEPNEGDGIAFTQRATKMLALLFLAAREENRKAGEEKHRLLPFVAQMADLGLNSAARKLHAISPGIARRLLEGDFNPHKDYDENKFLSSAWESLTSRLYPLLTKDVLRCFAGSDFMAQELMLSKQPISLYLRWPEAELLALAPLVRLVWESLIHELITTYDKAAGQHCRPVLLLIDEAGRTAIPSLHDHATTVVGRGISLWIAIQSLSQLDAIYGKHRADTLRNNCESQLYYRQASHETAKYLEECLGKRSDFAHSQTLHKGVEISQGQVEQAVELMTAQAIKQMGDNEIIGWHRELMPFKAKRMDWRDFPLLIERRSIPPPPLPILPPLDEHPPDLAWGSTKPESSWRLAPDLLRWGNPSAAVNGLRKNISNDGDAGLRP
jgi:type IV secretion system protein VirD4